MSPLDKMRAVAVAQAIRSLGEVPSGHLYAKVMAHVTHEQYKAIIAALVDSGVVKQSSAFMLTWVAK